MEAVLKIVGNAQRRDANRFKMRVFEYFESVYNKALGR
jgi:hypothetical protein